MHPPDPTARTSGPTPLGVHLTPDGAHAAVLASRAEAVEVVLLVDADAGTPGAGTVVRSVALTEQTHGVWHGHLDGVREGQRYGLRVHGPWEPHRGNRHNPTKLLLDPYARALSGQMRYGPEVFGHAVDDATWLPVDGSAAQGGASRRDGRDSAAHVPHAVLVAPPVAEAGARLRVPWSQTVLYEAHVRGLTMAHPDVPPDLRGTYAALGHRAIVEHLVGLGVTSLELLPIHAIGDEPALARRSRHNYWGYNTLSFFAPEPRYASAAARAAGPKAVLAELAAAVDALHRAGIEVLLDVVYNHTCEGGVDGPTLSWRGLDAATYYRLDSRGRDIDVTGTGNTLDFRNARVVQLALDSLRYWVTAFGVDGFRFDLAPALARGRDGYDPDHPFLVAARTDPLLQEVKLIAEPWDVGPNGWRTGQLPAPFAEWNDRFRDDVRTFWLADAAGGPGHGVRSLATRLAGSADFFGHSSAVDAAMRGPLASVNLLTSHDGFTLADCTAYERKHNWDNGESNTDGHHDNRTFNHGVEGRTSDPQVRGARRRSARALLGTLLLSTGVPMLTAGDELGRTQGGNNNAYCTDDETTWLDWAGADLDLLATTATLLAWRRELAVLRQDRVFAGRPAHPDGTTDLGWFAHDGTPMDSGRWHDDRVQTLQMFLHAGGWGHVLPGGSVLLVLHAGARPVAVRLPDRPWATSYRLVWDAAAERPRLVQPQTDQPGADVTMAARSLRLYRALA